MWDAVCHLFALETRIPLGCGWELSVSQDAFSGYRFLFDDLWTPVLWWSCTISVVRNHGGSGGGPAEVVRDARLRSRRLAGWGKRQQ